MKTYLLFFAILFANYSNTEAQPSNHSNQIEISTELEDGTTIINWSTNQEVNSKYFLVEKSIDGVQFEVIHQQKAGSSTYGVSNYSFEDAGEINVYTQYRVVLVTMEGQRIPSELNADFASALAK